MAPLSLDSNPSSKAMWRNDTGSRIYLDKDGAVVTDPERQDAVTFLVGPGLEIPLERAKALGLVKPEEPGEPEAVEPDEDALFNVPGLPHQAVESLKAAGLWSAEALGEKTDDELTGLAGVGAASVEKIRKALEG